MNLRHLEVFHTIMVSSSMTEAATKLHISQPAVSTMLRHLESTIGIKLFDRSGGRLRPTPEALILSKEVSEVFDHVEAIERTIESLRDSRNGTLRVAVAPTIADALLPTAIEKFSATRPDVNIKVCSLASSLIAQRVKRREIDFGIIYGKVGDELGVVSELLCERRIGCIMRPEHPLASRSYIEAVDLVNYDFVSYEKASAFGQLIWSEFERHGFTFTPKYEVSTSQMACHVANRANSLALVDETVMFSGAHPSLIVRPLKPEIVTEITAVFPAVPPRRGIVRLFAKSFRAETLEYFSGSGTPNELVD